MVFYGRIMLSPSHGFSESICTPSSHSHIGHPPIHHFPQWGKLKLHFVIPFPKLKLFTQTPWTNHKAGFVWTFKYGDNSQVFRHVTHHEYRLYNYMYIYIYVYMFTPAPRTPRTSHILICIHILFWNYKYLFVFIVIFKWSSPQPPRSKSFVHGIFNMQCTFS